MYGRVAVWPYCSECGCRLEIAPYSEVESVLSHFGNDPNRDARGCKCSLRFNAKIVPNYKIKNFIGV